MILEEVVADYALPPLGEVVTTGICAPTLIDFGSDDQKRRHLPAMLRGEELWTQLFSEPGAGSDLAGLRQGGAGRRPVRGQRTEGVDPERRLRPPRAVLVRTRRHVPEAPRHPMLGLDLQRPASRSGRCGR